MNLDLFVIPYSFKSMNLNQEEILKLAAQIGFDGVEGGTLTDEYLELLAKYGLKCCNCELHSNRPWPTWRSPRRQPV